MKKYYYIISIVIFIITLCFILFFYTKRNTIYHHSSIHLEYIRTSMHIYKNDFGAFPYAKKGNSDTALLMLLQLAEQNSSYQLLSLDLENPKTKNNNEIFYETFNLSKNEWDRLDDVWEKCMSNANFSIEGLPYRAPIVWEKQLIHGSDNLLYVEDAVETCKNGKNFLKLVKMVKEEIKASRAKKAKY